MKYLLSRKNILKCCTLLLNLHLEMEKRSKLTRWPTEINDGEEPRGPLDRFSLLDRGWKVFGRVLAMSNKERTIDVLVLVLIIAFEQQSFRFFSSYLSFKPTVKEFQTKTEAYDEALILSKVWNWPWTLTDGVSRWCKIWARSHLSRWCVLDTRTRRRELSKQEVEVNAWIMLTSRWPMVKRSFYLHRIAHIEAELAGTISCVRVLCHSLHLSAPLSFTGWASLCLLFKVDWIRIEQRTKI